MANKLTTRTLARRFDVSTMTIGRLEKEDETFPRSQKIGRVKFYDEDFVDEWVNSRSTEPQAFILGDRLMSGARLLELTNRSKSWLWLNVIKPKKLIRINLSPNPESNKLVNNFIEREVYAAFGDLIEVAKRGGE